MQATDTHEITLEEGEHVDVVLDGRTVRVRHQIDGDGQSFLCLDGVGCSLDGDAPGDYYLTGHQWRIFNADAEKVQGKPFVDEQDALRAFGNLAAASQVRYELHHRDSGPWQVVR